MSLFASGHAVGAFIERVRPGLDYRGAREALESLLRLVDVVEEPPGWAAWLEADAYAVVGDVVFPLHRAGGGCLVATTCITWASLGGG